MNELFKILGIVAIETSGAKDELDNITRKAKSTGDGFDNVDTKARNLAKGGFTVLKGVVSNLISSGFQRLISSMGQLVSSGVEYSKELEQYETSFAVMTGSAEKAAEVTEHLAEIAAKTPFGLNDVASATQLLINYGFSADDAVSKMTMLGDISQGSSEKLNRIATAYGQMSSAGKVLLVDVKQMIEAGFNPLQEISETTGESMDSLYDRISEGTISVDEITASIERSTSAGGKYFGSMDAQSQTLNGRLSTLKDTVNESIGNILGGLLQQAADEWIPKLTDAVSKVDEKFQAFMTWISEHQGLLTGLAIVIGVVTTALGLQAGVQAVAAAMNAAEATSLGALIAMKAANAAATIAALAPYLLIAAAIAAVIAIIVLCVKHWDEIKAKVIEVAQNIAEKISELRDRLSEIWSNIMTKVSTTWASIKTTVANKASEIFTTVSEKFNNIKNRITETIENARDKVKEAIDKMKSFFKFEWSLPKIKLPHINISGKFSLDPPSAPKFSIQWYKKGGILQEPTIFGMNGNKLMGGGEAGPEAVAPIDVLQGYVAEAVASQNAGLVEVLEKILGAILAMDANMGGNLREALDGTSFSINHREFGRLVKAVN